MRTSIATLAVASLITILSTVVAGATPTQVNVRIEGKSETLFEGPILTEGHYVQASSDTKERRCDGINVNDPHNKTPGPTSTAASADAMELIGETFDGQWYPGFEDYFITRWGPEKEEAGMAWGILVNNVFTNVGGCQYELNTGDEALWAYNAFQGRPFLALLPVGAKYSSGMRPLTATAELGEPFEVEVLDYSDDEEDTPPASPERTGSSPIGGADVSPVSTSIEGFEKVQTESSATEITNINGKASITFTEPGWHRIKATVLDGKGDETAIRSNRLDVCVPAPGADSCSEPFPEDQPRAVSRTMEEIEREQKAQQEEEAAARRAEKAKQEEARLAALKAKPETLGLKESSVGLAPSLNPVRVQTPIIDGLGDAHGMVGVSWSVLEPGAGISGWAVSSKTLGGKSTRYVTRATGTSATSATFALPRGFAYELQLTITDGLGRSSTTQFGKVLVPEDDRWSGLRYQGRWRHAALSGTWLGTVTIGGRGTGVSARLSAGRAVFLLRGRSSSAEVEVSSGSRHRVFGITHGPPDALRQVVTAQRSKTGAVSLRVLRGTVDLDGVGVEP